MATKAELKLRAARRIALVSEGAVLTAYQDEVLDDAVDAVQAFLEEQGIAYWETSDIPEAVMFGLIDCVGSQAAKDLYDADRAGQYSGLWEIGERRLRQHTKTGPGDRPVRGEYF